MEFQAVRLDTLIRSIIERTRMNHPNFEAHLELDTGIQSITGDPKRLGQVFENLFNNAIKYAPGSDVWVKIGMDEAGTNITVQDHGPGIPQRYLPHLFERFFRNPEISPSVHGTGLGLFICKKIILAHKGQISASSTVGQGTQFHIFLPHPAQEPVLPMETFEEE
jgi:signal transduction histidine kinase